MMIGATAEDSAAPVLRRGLLWLAGLTVVGLTIELAAERHWTQPVQFVAWGALVVTVLAIGLVIGRSSPGRLKLARWLAIAVMISAGLGIWEHIDENHDSGELDQVYGETWDSLPAMTRWWLAASKTVGPSPPLAPGALAVAGFCVLLATTAHPALQRRR
jgi:hypothetical protein